MPHCSGKSRARQSKCLCIASEIVAKLFDFLAQSIYPRCRRCRAEQCARFPEGGIQLQDVNPE
jgi:hypothetical protein